MVMKVILLRDIEKIGRTGDVVGVKDGYARNYLFPQKMALPATDQNIKVAEENKKRLSAALKKEMEEAQRQAEAISRASCTIAVEAGKDDKIFGSVTSADIQGVLEAEGIIVDKRKIELKEHIDQIGIYQIPIKLHPEVTAALKLWVVKR